MQTELSGRACQRGSCQWQLALGARYATRLDRDGVRLWPRPGSPCAQGPPAPAARCGRRRFPLPPAPAAGQVTSSTSKCLPGTDQRRPQPISTRGLTQWQQRHARRAAMRSPRLCRTSAAAPARALLFVVTRAHPPPAQAVPGARTCSWHGHRKWRAAVSSCGLALIGDVPRNGSARGQDSLSKAVWCSLVTCPEKATHEGKVAYQDQMRLCLCYHLYTGELGNACL